MQGFAADPGYVKGEVFAYVGLPQNLKDLKDGGGGTLRQRVRHRLPNTKHLSLATGGLTLRACTALGTYTRPKSRALRPRDLL